MFSMTGCSTKASNLAKQKQWEGYYAAKMAQINKPQQKQFDVNVGEDGKFQGVTIYAVAPKVDINRPTEDYHPAWAIGGKILQSAVPYLGVIGTAKVVSDGMVDLAKSTQGTVTTNTYTDSYNTAGQDYAGGDMSNSIAGDTISAGQDYAGGDMSNSIAGDTIGADYYNAGGDVATNANPDSSITAGNDYAGNDYYPDSSDNSDNSTTGTVPEPAL